MAYVGMTQNHTQKTGITGLRNFKTGNNNIRLRNLWNPNEREEKEQKIGNEGMPGNNFVKLPAIKVVYQVHSRAKPKQTNAGLEHSEHRG